MLTGFSEVCTVSELLVLALFFFLLIQIDGRAPI